jgi:hypothetical protein
MALASAIKCPRSVDFEAELPRDRYWQRRVSNIV